MGLVKTAFVIFDKMTALDLVAVYDPLTRLSSMGIREGFTWEFCSLKREVRDDRGLAFSSQRVGESLAGYDLLIVPGGFGTRQLKDDEGFLAWLRTAAPVGLKASVCTGALLLGAAGFLAGRRATTHPNAYGELRPYCAAVVEGRVVDEGPVVTAGGVTAGIDLGLHLVGRLAGCEAQAAVARQMDYPFCGAWETGLKHK